MAHILEGFVNKKIQIITNDGRNIIGIFTGFDQVINIILHECQERVYSESGVEVLSLGLYIIRGDNISLIGEINVELDEQIDFSKIKAPPLKPIVH